MRRFARPDEGEDRASKLHTVLQDGFLRGQAGAFALLIWRYDEATNGIAIQGACADDLVVQSCNEDQALLQQFDHPRGREVRYY